MRAQVQIGTQSWNFGAWVGSFYPTGMSSPDMLGFYARVFNTLEVDSTFYGIPATRVLENWSALVSDEFRFALKVPQQITRERRLQNTEAIVEKFLHNVSVLGDHLGPLLVQLSPDFLPIPENRDRLQRFLTQLAPGFRWAFEFRHSGWISDATLDDLARANAALVLTDGRWHRRERMLELAATPTADFGYLRWMGPGRHLTDYSQPQIDRTSELDDWSTALKSMAAHVDNIYGYFNNQFQGHSPHSARELQRRLGQVVVEPEGLHPQVELF